MDMMDMDTYVKVKGKVAEARLLKLRRLLIAKKTLYNLHFSTCPYYLLQVLYPNPTYHIPIQCHTLIAVCLEMPSQGQRYILGHSTAGCGSCHLSSSTENGRASGRQSTQVPKALHHRGDGPEEWRPRGEVKIVKVVLGLGCMLWIRNWDVYRWCAHSTPNKPNYCTSSFF